MSKCATNGGKGVLLEFLIDTNQFQQLDSCSGYLRKENAVVSIVLPFAYRGLAHFAVHLKNSHRKKEEILRWTEKKKKFLDGQ